jgi:ATP-binding cassette subfamily F protein 3
VLEKALKEYSGTLLLVSHDRWFIQQVANAILVINGPETKFYPLTYDEYVSKVNGTTPPIQPAGGQAVDVNVLPSTQAAAKRYNTKQTAMLEKKIDKAEAELEELRQLRFEPEYYQDVSKMNELNDTIDDKHNEIAHLMKEWEEHAAQL